MQKPAGDRGPTRRFFLSAGTAAVAVAATRGGARAAEWPTRSVTILVPYAAGGLSDILARLFAQIMSEKFGQPFVVENRLGGGGVVSALAVANAAPDGYTLFLSPPGPLIIVPMMEQVAYDSSRFVPIATVQHGPLLLAIRSSLAPKTLGEFIAYAKANPGKLNYSSGGTGAVTHLLPAMFASRAGINLVHVPYKGTAPAILALLSGEVDMFFSTVSEITPYLTDERVRILATSSEQRLANLPAIPAIGEAFPGFSLDPWNGLLAPAGTPRPIVDKIADVMRAAAKEPWVVDRLARMNNLPGGSTPEEFAKIIADDKVFYKAALEAAGMGKK